MRLLETADGPSILEGRLDRVGAADLRRLAAHPLACITTEYPHYAFAVDGPEGPDRPSAVHPIFHGCFDWHSAVHSHWALIRQLRLVDEHPLYDDVIEAVDPKMTPENGRDEAEFLRDHPRFERPYGWAWLLRLVAELDHWDTARGDSWSAALDPIEQVVIALVETEFLPMSRPLRVGTHGNAAFAIGGIIDYARTVGRRDLERRATETARSWFLEDTDYPLAYEPIGWDFVSPGLVEVETMARVLEADAFIAWFEAFLPALVDDGTAVEPVVTEPDDGDGMAMHLVGLNLSRSWCLANLADVLGDHPAAGPLERSAQQHARAGLAASFTDDYTGSHWLSSFALYLLSRKDGLLGPTLSGRS